MFRDVPVIDAAARKIENPTSFLDALDADLRARVRLVAAAEGHLVWEIDDADARGGRRAWRFPAAALSPYAERPTTLGAMFPRARLGDMDRVGVDVQILHPTLATVFSRLRDAELAAALCRAYNEAIADECAAAPTRLVPVGVVPAQDVAAATAELRYCAVDLAMPAIAVPAGVPRPHPAAGDAFPEVAVREGLAAAQFRPLWETAEFLGVAVVVHPWAAAAGDAVDVLVDEVVDQPGQAQRTLAELVVHGVLERHPQLRFGVVDAGCGWLPNFVFELCDRWQRRDLLDAPPVFSSRRFAVEYLRERGRRGWLGRRRGLRELRSMVSGAVAPTLAAAEGVPAERNPEEYFARGQVFVTCGSDDPGAAHLRDAFGPVGERLACWSTGYGRWHASDDGALEKASSNPQLGLDYVTRLVSTNAIRLYGERLRRRLAPGYPAASNLRARPAEAAASK